MNGLELSRRYFYQAALPLLQSHFPAIASRCAAGLCAGGLDVGAGSEIYGFDDNLSQDHNWGPRFFLFLSQPDYDQSVGNVRKALSAMLSPTFEGLTIQPTSMQAMHFHVTTPVDNALAALDVDALPGDDLSWYCIPEHRLCEYAAGLIYYDPMELMGFRDALLRCYPDSVRRKRLAGAFFMMHTAGNAIRCAKRGEVNACRSYLDMAITSAIRAVFLLHGRFTPHVKWRLRSLAGIPDISSQWIACVQRLSLSIPQELPALLEEINALLAYPGELLQNSGMIASTPLWIDSEFLSFNCYGLSKALEATIQGDLADRPLAVALDQMTESFQPLSPKTLRAHWQAGRPGIANLLL